MSQSLELHLRDTARELRRACDYTPISDPLLPETIAFVDEMESLASRWERFIKANVAELADKEKEEEE